MAAQVRLRIAEQLADMDIRASKPPPALLQDTVDQFEKVMVLERNLLCKSIQKLENDLEETDTEVSMKEEELMVWEEKLQQIQQANETKLRLAKAQLDKKKWRNPAEGRHGSGVRGSPALGLITECDEDSDEEEPEGEEAVAEKAEDPLLPAWHPGSTAAPSSMVADRVKEVNGLASRVADELAALRSRWQLVSQSLRAAREAATAQAQAQPMQSAQAAQAAQVKLQAAHLQAAQAQAAQAQAAQAHAAQAQAAQAQAAQAQVAQLQAARAQAAQAQAAQAALLQAAQAQRLPAKQPPRDAGQPAAAAKSGEATPGPADAPRGPQPTPALSPSPSGSLSNSRPADGPRGPPTPTHALSPSPSGSLGNSRLGRPGMAAAPLQRRGAGAGTGAAGAAGTGATGSTAGAAQGGAPVGAAPGSAPAASAPGVASPGAATPMWHSQPGLAPRQPPFSSGQPQQRLVPRQAPAASAVRPAGSSVQAKAVTAAPPAGPVVHLSAR